MKSALSLATAVGAVLATSLTATSTAATAQPTDRQVPQAAQAGAPHRPARQPMNEQVLWQESFDGQASPTGFTHRAPRGWTIASSGFTTGEQRWAGWAFTNVRDWTWAVGTERRHWFTGAHDTVAVVESKHQRLAPRDHLTTTLTSPPVQVAGQRDLALRFDSHYAQGKAPQSAYVTVSFDGGAPQRLLTLDKDRLSAHEDLTVTVPRGAGTARFSWTYDQGRNDLWWAVDNVALVRAPKPVQGAPVATFDVLSDIHAPRGNAKYVKAIRLLTAQPDKAGALLLNGDVVDLGTAEDYASATQMLKATPHPSGTVLMGSGNHELLGKEDFAAYQKRFLALAGRSVPWGEVTVNGIPALSFSTEYYSDVDREGKEPYVTLGRQQLAWLESRLATYARRGTPVVLMNHHPLPQSVSFTHSAWYGNDFADLEVLNAVIAKYPNVIYLSGHTHAWLGLNDWWGRYRVDGSGNPDGFPAVNTGAVLNAGVPDDDHDEATLPGEHTTGLRLKVFRDRVRVEAWDVEAGTVMKHQDFPVTQAFAQGR
ncbi:metallophosphoesterase family protein [Arsenicicoccus dermatophilus]|uniref:metallophosphoesterase family protein n=1 Tax=Arsenicicoccus dermatophilus TaxID=1076331 RepID=UPI0039170E37